VDSTEFTTDQRYDSAPAYKSRRELGTSLRMLLPDAVPSSPAAGSPSPHSRLLLHGGFSSTGGGRGEEMEEVEQ